MSITGQVARFARHFGRSPEHLGPAEIRSWQLYLTQDRHLAASSISVAVAALRFLYTVTLRRTWAVEDDIPTGHLPRKLPDVLSRDEGSALLAAVKSPKHRMILTICYAAGLRVSEAVSLKPTAIDNQRMVIRVEGGKGAKDRYVMLSPKLLEWLRAYWKATHPRGWLFPGEQAGEPISRFAVEHACRAARVHAGIGRSNT